MKTSKTLSVVVSLLLSAAAAQRCAAQVTEAEGALSREVSLERSSAHFDVRVVRDALDPPGLERLLASKEAVYERVRSFLGERVGQLPRIRLTLYPRISDKGRATQDTRIAHMDFERLESHLAVEEGLEGHAWDPETVALLRSALGEPRTRALEVGLGVRLSENWRGKGWEYWAARLFQAGMVLPLGELLDNELLDPDVYDSAWDQETRSFPLRESPLLYEPLAAAFVDGLIRTWGRSTFLERFAGWRPSEEEIAGLETEWHDHLAQLLKRHAGAIAHDRRRFPAMLGLQMGANHTFEGYSVDTGYLSEGSDASLERLKSIGANTVALVPYTYFLRRDGQASPLPFMRGPGKENDESMIHGGFTAKKLGMTVFLKPHIQGLWPGHIEMSSQSGWDAFFGFYERWIRHYALLAEIYQYEVLSLGVEMVKATTQHEDRWRELAARIRKIYSGALVYSANWGSELEQLGFWDAFDYIGIDSYYPLSDKDDASDAELLAGARSVVKRIEAVHRRFDRPVIFTEIGFVNTRAPWKEPWKGDRGEPEFEHQVRAFEVMFQALAGKPWCRGIYWWKWSSHPERYGGARDVSHIINGKPVELVLAKWFKRLGSIRRQTPEEGGG